MPYFDEKPCNYIKWLEEDLLPIQQAPFVLRGWEPPPLDSTIGRNYYFSKHFGTADEYRHLVRVIEAGIAKGLLRSVSLPIGVGGRDVEHIFLSELLPYLRRQGVHVRPELAELAKARGILPRTQGIVVNAEIRDLLQEIKARKGDKPEGAQHNEGKDVPREANENAAPAVATEYRRRRRLDAMSVEIERAIEELGDQATPSEIMKKLKSYAAKDEGCISKSGPKYVVWRNAIKDLKTLDMDCLRKRLDYRNKMNRSR
jgi:hypothetical protein